MERAEACILAAPQSVQSETERRTLERAIEAISAEDMCDETDDATDAAYSRAIRDCKDVLRALIDKPAAPDPVGVALARFFEAQWHDAGAGVARKVKWDDIALQEGLIAPDATGFDYELTEAGKAALALAEDNQCRS